MGSERIKNINPYDFSKVIDKFSYVNRDIYSGNENIHSDLQYNPSKIVIPFSKFFSKQLREDIYIGNEKIPFKRKHPVFKALMRVEFEDSMKEYLETI